MYTQKQKEHLKLVVYQIYPRSFKDSNGDGIGDLNGITEKLDYLKELGINAVWLSPCYKSPNEDNGYDISDYRDIMDEFGTLDDWKRMISEMHKRGIKLIMDLVANHTSTEHRWFRESRKSKDNPYRDYYYWADKPLTDWNSVFGGSAWEYDKTTDQYYLHSFAVGQPDLNWENPKVREEMKAVVDHWVSLGVDGFRCDVLDCISKDFEKGWMGGGPRFHEFVNELFGRPETEHIFTVGECCVNDHEGVKKLIGADRGELSTVFHFDHIDVGRTRKFDLHPFRLDEIRDKLIHWQTFYQQEELVGTLFIENHDQPRCISRFGSEAKRYESATMLAAMLFLQRGIPFIYQGQEIGSINPYTESIEDFDDVETLNYYRMNPDKLDERELMRRINADSRDNSRRPMPWSDEVNGGFGGAPWLPVHNRYKDINVRSDMSRDRSVYRFFKAIITLKTQIKAFSEGAWENLTEGRSGTYIYRRYTEDESYIIVCNFENESVLDTDYTCDFIMSNTEAREINGVYAPYECAVYKERYYKGAVL